MPINLLLVEGDLEVQVLNPILLGAPALKRGGPKGSLRPRAANERNDNRISAGYLRDRDFDFDPPTTLLRPIVDCVVNGVPVGWRWCRHETENYLIDPEVVLRATSLSRVGYEDALRISAAEIREYEVARWSVGMIRRCLPPLWNLPTRPEGLADIDLPAALDQASVSKWAAESIESFRQPMVAASDPAAVSQTLAAFRERLNNGVMQEVTSILVHFSGKDLLAGLGTWLVGHGFNHPSEFRIALRDWAIKNPEEMTSIFKEWDELRAALRA